MRARLLGLGVAMFVAAFGAVGPGAAQQSAPPPAQDVTPGIPRIPLTIFQTAPVIPREAVTRDDLKHVPPPPVDRLSEAVHATVVIGSPQCLPGEDGLFGPEELSRARRPRAR